MKWFEHHTSDRDLPQSKIIRSKFGAEGYGIYISLLEVIGENVLESNTDDWGSVSKIHDVESLAVECATTPEKLREFLEFCNQREIFEKKDGRLYTSLILDRLDNYAKRIKRGESTKLVEPSANLVELSTTLQKQSQKQIQTQRHTPLPPKQISKVEGLTEEVCEKIAKTYDLPVRIVLDKREDLRLYCASRNKTYQNYEAALSSWIRKDIKDGKIKVTGFKRSVKAEIAEAPRSQAVVERPVSRERLDAIRSQAVEKVNMARRLA